jgi:hypothetical protein
MAKALNVPETEHTHGDLTLTVKAQELELVGTVFPPSLLHGFFYYLSISQSFFVIIPLSQTMLICISEFFWCFIMQPSTANWMLEMGRIEKVSLMISSRQNLQISLKCNLVTALLLHVSLYISHLLLIYCHFQTI